MKDYNEIISKTAKNTITGIILGLAILFITLIALSGLAYITDTTVIIPGFFHAWFTKENDMPALNFEPNRTGMLIFIIITTVIYLLSTKKPAQQSISR